MKRITVIGSLNMDVSVTTPRIPRIGETVLGSELKISPGGKGANQAVAASRLGADVAIIGCVGDDVFGQQLLANLAENNISSEYIYKMKSVSTGVAVIVVKDGNNAIVVNPGANDELKPSYISALSKVIEESSLVISQLEIPLETVEEVIKTAKMFSVPVLLNPAPARELSDELLSNVDIFTPNETECETITGIKINGIEDAKKALVYLKDKGIQQVLITIGSQGVIYNRGEEIIHKPAREVSAVDTTAAGDSFSGALAVALISGNSIDEAVDFASIVGSLTVTKKGAQSSLPSIEEVRKIQNINNL